MLKVVLDTNTLVSAAIRKGNEFRILNGGRLGEYELLLSLDILKEFEDVLSRRRFGFTRDIVEDIVDEIISYSRVVKTKSKLNVITEDPSDNRVLECAVEGSANFIVSGDKHLRSLGEYHKVEIVSSREMLNILRR